jgi:hypothetical protein
VYLDVIAYPSPHEVCDASELLGVPVVEVNNAIARIRKRRDRRRADADAAAGPSAAAAGEQSDIDI